MDMRSGFSWVKLIVTLFILAIISAAFFPAGSDHLRAYLTAVGVRGKDIYVAITDANTERKAQGLPPIWPSDAPPYTNHITGRVECFNFENSTDYFAYILDVEHYGTKEWQPLVAGIDFVKLAGAGVEAHTGAGPLKAENNIWTIAKNISDGMDDLIPILVTRNLDAEMLLSKMDVEMSLSKMDAKEENANRIGSKEGPKMMFSGKGVVLIRKGGRMFTARPKYATPMVIYNRQSFDANAGSKYPLKYLTPTKEVIPIGKMR